MTVLGKLITVGFNLEFNQIASDSNRDIMQTCAYISPLHLQWATVWVIPFFLTDLEPEEVQTHNGYIILPL